MPIPARRVCPRCATSNDDDAVFCKRCALRVPRVPELLHPALFGLVLAGAGFGGWVATVMLRGTAAGPAVAIPLPVFFGVLAVSFVLVVGGFRRYGPPSRRAIGGAAVAGSLPGGVLVAISLIGSTTAHGPPSTPAPMGVDMPETSEPTDDRADPRIAAALRLWREGRLEEADAIARETLERDPSHFAALVLRCQLGGMRGAYEPAIAHCRRALASRRTRLALTTYASVLCKAAVDGPRVDEPRLAEARAAVDEALALDPDSQAALLVAAEIYAWQADGPKLDAALDVVNWMSAEEERTTRASHAAILARRRE